MSPSHANKKGVRYRYYVSQALLQNHKAEAGTVARVSAPDVEALVARAVEKAVRVNQEMAPTEDESTDRDLVLRNVERVTIHVDHIAVALRSPEAGPDHAEGEVDANLPIHLAPFAPNSPPRKGIVHAPAESGTIDPKTRDALLQAIARSRAWMDAILAGKTASFDDIASAEGLAERHVRRLAPLAFLSPKVIQAIAEGGAPVGLTVSRLTESLPHSWAAQEQLFGLG
jgi:hypothetical protein